MLAQSAFEHLVLQFTVGEAIIKAVACRDGGPVDAGGVVNQKLWGIQIIWKLCGAICWRAQLRASLESARGHETRMQDRILK